tara:strand:+ start:3943 stop:4314 length:372 start_codon:yes stop_codon:yes gene_type:complete
MCSGGCNISLKELNGDLRSQIAMKQKISKDDFIAGKPETIAMYAYFLNPKGFLEAFRDKGINFDADNLAQEIGILGFMSEEGSDESGEMPDDNGKPLPFNFMEIVNSIRLPKKALGSNNIQFI